MKYHDCRAYEGQPAELTGVEFHERRGDGTINGTCLKFLIFHDGGAQCVLNAIKGADNVILKWDNATVTFYGRREVRQLERLIQAGQS